MATTGRPSEAEWRCFSVSAPGNNTLFSAFLRLNAKHAITRSANKAMPPATVPAITGMLGLLDDDDADDAAADEDVNIDDVNVVVVDHVVDDNVGREIVSLSTLSKKRSASK